MIVDKVTHVVSYANGSHPYIVFKSPNGIDLLSIRAPGTLSYLDEIFSFGDAGETYALIYHTFFSYPLNMRFDGNQTLQIGSKLTRFCQLGSNVYANNTATILRSVITAYPALPCVQITANSDKLLDTAYMSADILHVNHDFEVNGAYKTSGEKVMISNEKVEFTSGNQTTDYLSPGGALTLRSGVLLYRDGEKVYLRYDINRISPVRRDQPVIIQPQADSLPLQSSSSITRIEYRSDIGLSLYADSDIWAHVEGPLVFNRSQERPSVSITPLSTGQSDSLFDINLSASSDEAENDLIYDRDSGLMIADTTVTLTEAATLLSTVDNSTTYNPEYHVAVLADGHIRMGLLSVQSEFRDLDISEREITVTLEDNSTVQIPTVNQTLILDDNMMVYLGENQCCVENLIV